MTGNWKIVLLVLAVVIVNFGYAAAETMKFATPIKFYPPYALPAVTAEAKGFWKQNGLDAKWIPFKGSVAMTQALAAGSIDIGAGAVAGILQAAGRGLPVLAVAQLDTRDRYAMWVRTAGDIKKPADLKGKKIGVSRIGGLDFAFSTVILQNLGLDKQVKFIGTGGILESIAMFKTGSIDARLASYYAFVRLKVGGQANELLLLEDYLPKRWVSSVVFVRRPFLAKDPETVRRTVKTMIQTINFIAQNRAWAIDKMKAEFRYNDEAAAFIYRMLNYTKDGKIDVEGLNNVRKLLIDAGIITEEKTPPLKELYSADFAS
jgi:NitT/TauT family transport system substrate-binding protein